jgi:hypothetical protein
LIFPDENNIEKRVDSTVLMNGTENKERKGDGENDTRR